MSFVGGLLVGVVAGLTGGVILARPRRRGLDGEPGGRVPARRSRWDFGGVAIVIASLALAASGVAIVRSGRQHHSTPSAPAGASSPTSTTAPTNAASTTTTVTAGAGTVAVPNVVGLARATAESSIQSAGLKAIVETLSLANVPAGFVISQNPLPAAQVTVGATVSLVVSGAT